MLASSTSDDDHIQLVLDAFDLPRIGARVPISEVGRIDLEGCLAGLTRRDIRQSCKRFELLPRAAPLVRHRRVVVPNVELNDLRAGYGSRVLDVDRHREFPSLAIVGGSTVRLEYAYVV